MNVLLSILQVLLALHTAAGAVWKLSNSEQAVPSLSAIPHGVWLALMVLELLCSLALIASVIVRRLAVLAPVAAGCIAAEMLLFTGVSLGSGHAERGEIAYWLVVAAVCAFIVRGRLARRRGYGEAPSTP